MAELFDNDLLDYSKFSENPSSILSDQNLVVRIDK